MKRFHLLSAFLILATWSTQYSTAAQAGVRWTPNPDRGSASSTLSGGRRGTPFAACALDDDQPDPAITLLVPDGGVSLTTEAQPTLSWFLETETMADMEFTLIHPDQATPIYSKSVRSGAGLVEVSLPDSVALEAGVPYRWTVFVECEGGDYTIHARSFVERTADAEVGLTADMSSLERADAYATRGIWYDALNTLVAAYRQDGEMLTLLEIRDLLRQADTDVPLELSLATE